jgi:hypothetical protein
LQATLGKGRLEPVRNFGILVRRTGLKPADFEACDFNERRFPAARAIGGKSSGERHAAGFVSLRGGELEL